ncbi:hypothetical protein [Paenibacillus sp. P46E]|uniref:hypothetical protein n=1 Tax=Paenibacillus sp. P46E TaxID=1349436 RepID=UPI00093CC587|nr:hypothetical protein [Paenibacillus sp. P46E]OKP97782.1 hypothetical protein A3849_13850 [Paenibacillus sp. P46E]
MSIKNVKKDEAESINASTLDASTDGKMILEEATTEDVKRIAPLIYVGPNLPGGRLLQSTVFRGGIPVYLQPLLKEQPYVSALIVPVDEMSGVQEKIVQTGTAEFVAYQAILKGGTPDGV